jgi:hypothetical protein
MLSLIRLLIAAVLVGVVLGHGILHFHKVATSPRCNAEKNCVDIKCFQSMFNIFCLDPKDQNLNDEFHPVLDDGLYLRAMVYRVPAEFLRDTNNWLVLPARYLS